MRNDTNQNLTLFFHERKWEQNIADRLQWCRVLNRRESRDRVSVTHDDRDRKVAEVSACYPCRGNDFTIFQWVLTLRCYGKLDFVKEISLLTS